jgi:hypothetical protein
LNNYLNKLTKLIFFLRFDTNLLRIPATTSRIVDYILRRTPFGTGEGDVGIEKAISQDVYRDAFPLHDVSWNAS